MRFGEYLRSNLTPEWSNQYVSYEDMKIMLSEIINEIPSTNQIAEYLTRDQYFQFADKYFFQFCEKELSKVNLFFAEKLTEALSRLQFLKNELDYIERLSKYHHIRLNHNLYKERHENSNEEEEEENVNSWLNQLKLKQLNLIDQFGKMKRHQYQKLSDLKLAFSEFYLMISLLKSYQMLNFTAFRKILKKHDKLFQTNRGNQWRILNVDCSPFHQSKGVDQLIEEVEKLYTDVLESGDRTRAMQRLRIPPLEEKQPRIVTFRLGMFIGMLCILFPMLIILGLSLFGPHSSKSLNWRAGVHLYRSSLLMIIEVIFFGLNVYNWSKFGVNHVLIFEIDPRNHLTYQKIIEIGVFIMVIWFLSLNAFLITFYLDYYPYIQPLAFLIFLIIFVINPFSMYYRQSRYWFVKKLFRVIFSPLYHVRFCDFWLGDQLCSLELIFFDLEFYLCFYISGSNISSSDIHHTFFCNSWTQVFLQTCFISLPSWFRFVQCIRRCRDTKNTFPHLLNAGKYASTFFVHITNSLRRSKSFDYHHNQFNNPFLYLWIIISLISSTYKILWDIKMDWGFWSKSPGKNKYLREQIVYPKTSYYYFSILSNIIFRYIWMINIFFQFESIFAEFADLIGFTFGFIEIFRRFIWNHFRLENEHLNNCGQFRAVRDISIVPNIIDPNNELFDQRQTTNEQNHLSTTNNTNSENIPLLQTHHSSSSSSSFTNKQISQQFIRDLNILVTNQIT